MPLARWAVRASASIAGDDRSERLVVVAVCLRECQWGAQRRAAAHRVFVLLEHVAGFNVVGECFLERLEVLVVAREPEGRDGLHAVIASQEVRDIDHAVIASRQARDEARLAELDERQARYALPLRVQRDRIPVLVAVECLVVRCLEVGAWRWCGASPYPVMTLQEVRAQRG